MLSDDADTKESARSRAHHAHHPSGMSLPGRLLFIGLEAFLIAVAIVVGWLLGTPPLEEFAWTWHAAAYGTCVALPLVALAIVATLWLKGIFGRLMQVVDNVLVPLFRSWSISELALVSILAGIGEEMLFRGVLQAWLAGWLGVWGGLLLASAIFGAVHWITPLYALLAALMGLALGGLWLATGNLLAPMLTHAWYDFLVLVYLVRVRGGEAKARG